MNRHAVRSVDPTRFAMVPRNDVPRSAFDVLHGHKTTFDPGYLIPVYVDEVLPGDSYHLKMTALCRTSTPIVPMMDNLRLDSHFFFVPNRLVWSNWERFMGEQASPYDTTTFLMPYVEFVDADCAPGLIADYMGLTLNGSANTGRANALPFRAYNLIWNDWFRDEDLQTPLSVPLTDGPDTMAATYAVAYRGKMHDYFTSARPWPQKPNNQTLLPSTGAQGDPNNTNLGGWFDDLRRNGGVGAPITGIGVAAGASAPSSGASTKFTGSRTFTPGNQWNTSSTALFTTAGAGDFPDIRVLVNDLRTASMVQVMMERNARGGTRYAELIRSHFGVVSPDARLQRPEYLGGGSTMINVNPVAQTSASGATGTTTKLGELAGVGSAMATNHGFSRSFTEHGVIIGLVSVRSFLTYQQGLERMWLRRTQFDFYWPALAHLGEQPVLTKELYMDGSPTDLAVFGYQERWAEYKTKPSRTSGYFRSTVATPLDMWHLGQKFASAPTLNNNFVIDNPPISRVLQVATNFGESFLFDSLFEIRKVRPMPMFSIPGMGSRL